MENENIPGQMRFEAWLDLVQMHLVKSGLIKPGTAICPKAWRVYYEDMLTPLKAINSDLEISPGQIPFGA